eukprot:468115-Pyramimonas_sp.AAC.1
MLATALAVNEQRQCPHPSREASVATIVSHQGRSHGARTRGRSPMKAWSSCRTVGHTTAAASPYRWMKA